MKVVEAGAERIPELRPLWDALQDHHAELPDVPPVRPRADSWEIRERQYREWITKPGTHLFIAERDERAVGYAMLTIGDAPATWDLGARVAEVETLSVLPEERSGGVGSALLDAAIEAAEAAGVSAIGVGVVQTNVDGVRFYERAGFKPFYAEMLRLTDDVRPRDDPRQ